MAKNREEFIQMLVNVDKEMNKPSFRSKRIGFDLKKNNNNGDRVITLVKEGLHTCPALSTWTTSIESKYVMKKERKMAQYVLSTRVLVLSVSLFCVDFGSDSFITHDFHQYSQTDILDHNRPKNCWTTLDLKTHLQSSLEDCYVTHENSLDMIGCVHRQDLNISGILETCFHQERDRFTPNEWKVIFYITLAHLIGKA